MIPFPSIIVQGLIGGLLVTLGLGGIVSITPGDDARTKFQKYGHGYLQDEEGIRPTDPTKGGYWNGIVRSASVGHVGRTGR